MREPIGFQPGGFEGISGGHLRSHEGFADASGGFMAASEAFRRVSGACKGEFQGISGDLTVVQRVL